MASQVKVESVVVRRGLLRNSISLKGVQVVALLRGELEISEATRAIVPKNAVVSYIVPSGGDYSGMEVDLDGERSITISWEAEV